ncbi:MAG: PEP-CTERM sorting domain-containing protein [Rhodocyclaceae bacterium]|nr:PEP-CTERM sorting domain-containing protein [Rhodocyclaceae bacterium]
MNTLNTVIASTVIVLSLGSGAAHAALQGRDLNGSIDSFEAYYDTVLDITWLADANYAKTSGYDADGLMTANQAFLWAAGLSFTDGLHVYDNWRLPTIEAANGVSFNFNLTNDGSSDKGFNFSAPGTLYAGSTSSEMAYMYYNNLGNPGLFTPAGIATNCYVSSSNTCLDNVGPFSNLQASSYHYLPNGTGEYFVMSSGFQGATIGLDGRYAWAVSPGDVGVAAVPEADTWAMLLAGLGLIGAVTRQRRG